MKDAGANFVRLCHYPHHPAELDLCDELGLLAMAEIPLYWWNGTAEGEDACRRKLAAAERQLQTLIQRDRNHPSVIFWSVSNETEEQRPEVADGNRRLVRFARQLDPTRLAVHVSNHWQENPQFEDDDVVCVNAYPSLDGCAARGIRGTDLAGSTCFWQEGLATLHARVPGKPVLVTEFGSASLEGVFGTGAGEDTHAAILERESAGMQAPYVCGATVWCWADHAWPPAAFAYMKHLGTSPYGVVTRDRRSLAPLAAARRVFRPRAAAVPPPAPPGAEPPGGWPVTMIRPHLRDLPPVQFPPGFGIRAMRVEEAGLWADIEQDAEGFLSIPVELFFREFGEDLAAVPRRCFILTNEKGCGVGTVSAWYNRDFRGQDYGRIHWVAVRPAWQRRGLARAGLAYAMHALAQWHERCYLATSTARLPAIRLYLDFGFEPDLEPPGAREAWAPVLAALGRPASPA